MDNYVSFKKATKKILIAINVIIYVCSLFIVSLFLHSKLSYKLPYIPCNMQPKLIETVECYTSDRNKLKNDIDKLFGHPIYFLHYTKLNSNILGYTSIYFGQIYIQNNIKDWEFVFTLAHELVHLTKFTASERYCHLTSFQKLMTSDNEYFKYVAQLWLNIDILGGLAQEYSFAGYVQSLYN